jgi:hypothetical protein
MQVSLSKTLLFGLMFVSFLLASCDPKPDPGVTNPSSFEASPGLKTVDLSWSTVTGATGYTLERQEGSGAFQPVLSDKNQTNYQDTNLKESTNYTYRLKALKGSTASTGVTKAVKTLSQGQGIKLSALIATWTSKQAVTFSQGQEVATISNAPSNVTVGADKIEFMDSRDTDEASYDGEALYYIGGLCNKFTATVTGSGTFRVFADESKIAESTGGAIDAEIPASSSKQNLSLVFQGTGTASWTNPTLFCQSTPTAPSETYLKGKWGAVFDWGDGVARGTPGDPRNPGYYERGYIVPTHVANLPDGRIASWAAWREFTYGRKVENPPFIDQTAGYVWNPAGTAASNFKPTDNPTHDMFCAGLALTADGRVFVAGGGSTLAGGAVAPSQYKASFFDFRTNGGAGSWKESRPGGANAFKVDHWYGSAVALPDNRLFVVGGSGGDNLGRSAEIGGANDGASWTNFTGADTMFPPTEDDMDIGSSVTIGGEPINKLEWGEARGWYPFLNVAPDGSLFQSGPQPRLKDITINANTVTPNTAAGLPKSHELMRTWGNSVMFDEGKILVSGGTPIRGTGASNTAMVLDISSNDVGIQLTPNMRFRRAHHNSVVLPTGDVLMIGGNNSGKQFTDGIPLDPDGFLENDPNSATSTNANYRWPSDIATETVFTPELYSPDKNTWRDLTNMKEPRNYHSVGVLLQDGRVLAAGGGLCGDNPTDSSNPSSDDSKDCNHPNGEIFEPPYLFNPNGSTAKRPEIGGLGAGASTNPDVAGSYKLTYGSTFNVTMTGLGDGSQISKFSMIKLSAVTHSINTDVRYLEYSPAKGNMSGSGSSYTLTTTGNKNVLTPGYYFLFALNDKGVPSVAKVVQIN